MEKVRIHAPRLRTVDPWHPVEILAALQETKNPLKDGLPGIEFQSTPGNLTIFPEKVWNPNSGEEHPELRAWLKGLEPSHGVLLLDGTCDREGPADPFLIQLCQRKFKQTALLRFGLETARQYRWNGLTSFQEIEQPYWMEKNADSLDAIPPIQPDTPISILFDGTIQAGPSDRLGFKTGFQVPAEAATIAIAASLKISTSRLQGFRKGCAHKLRQAAVEMLHPLPVDTPHLKSGVGFYQQGPAEKEKQFAATCKALQRHPYLLCIRGNGNYSIRFYYGLRAGRIPVVIDTGSAPPPLPSGWREPNIIRCPAAEISSLPEKVREFHQSRNLEEASRHNRACAQESYGFHNFAGHLLAHLLA